MKFIAYDIEVFAFDWVVVFYDLDLKKYTVIHNNNYELREFLKQKDFMLFGYNVKHYDDWVLLTMIGGGSNLEVKKHNDWIINGGAGWEFPFILFQKKPFNSFDLRDDIPDKGLSLKAIEGNLKLPIVESSVPFDIDRPLTPAELDEVIKYCKHDVDATVQLYFARKKNYIDAKALVADMYHVPKEKALGLTNAKLSALVLEAKKVNRADERNYKLPPNIDPAFIPKKILDFFLQITDLTIPDARLFGAGKGSKGLTLDVIIKTAKGSCPVTYAWGGVHGAKPCTTVEQKGSTLLINQDVASLYPNSMINFGYCSRSMKDPEAYEKLVKKRLGYKHAGDKEKAGALKLVVNTVYGAMLNVYNDLVDRWAGRSVCISNQLAMTVLIVQLAQNCETIDFININTDGIMYTIDRKEEKKAEAIVHTWSEITKFEMERDDFVKVIQKDVNNYIGIKADGSFKTKGGYVSLYKGGDFKTNSLQIIHRAIVDYLVQGIDPEKTIKACDDIFQFQQIVKTGSTYDGAFQYIDGERVPIQNVNRIYAVKDPKVGQIVKGKWIREKRRKNPETGKMDSTPVDPPIWQETVISECPAHAGIDNENKLTVQDLDLNYYIDMAWRRIKRYTEPDKTILRKIKKMEVLEIMPARKTAQPAEVDSNLLGNIYEKLLLAREMFASANVKKTGKNSYAEFKYFTLEDIVPVKNKIFKQLGIVDIIRFYQEPKTAELYLINADKPEESVVFSCNLAPDNSLIKNPIQSEGAVQTYVRRYLYMLVLDIIEADLIEETSGKPEPGKQADKKPSKPVSPEKKEEIKEEILQPDGLAEEVQIKSIKRGLKKLRDKDLDKYTDYVNNTILKLKKGGTTKKEAEDLMIEISRKIEE